MYKRQLLTGDGRVVSIEGFNARYLTEAVIGCRCDIAVMDVSFISQRLLYSAVSSVLKDDGIFISLIKPQFEAGREYIKKGGICLLYTSGTEWRFFGEGMVINYEEN